MNNHPDKFTRKPRFCWGGFLLILMMHRCNFSNFRQLSRFLVPLLQEDNGSISVLYVNAQAESWSIESTIFQEVVSFLSKFKALQVFIFNALNLDDEGSAELIRILHANHTEIKLLILDCQIGGGQGCQALATWLKDPGCKIESLDLKNNQLGKRYVTVLAEALTFNTSVKSLNLSGNFRVSLTQGWPELFNFLESATCGIESINLGSNSLVDDHMKQLVSGLANNKRLVKLNLARNREVTTSGWVALASFLRSPSCMLREININHNDIRDQTAIAFANSLAVNQTLTTLIMLQRSAPLTTATWDVFSQMLCNPTNIMATYLSNHTLSHIHVAVKLPDNLKLYLDINRSNTKSEAARKKVFKTHFRGNFDMQPFVDIKVGVLPLLVAWLAATECNDDCDGDNHDMFTAVYHFVKNMPVLFAYSCKPVKTGPDRKRQKVAC